MSYQNLLVQVRKELGLMQCNSTLKLTYQYPEWLAIEEGNGSPPQYISDNADVSMFSMLRREIEEVNLFITVSHPILNSTTIFIGGQSSQHAANWSNWISEDETSSDSEDYYHDFSSIPSPTENNLARNLLNEFNMAANVTTQLTITPTAAGVRSSRDKGKGVVVNIDESSADDPPQRDYRMVPCSSKSIPPSAFALTQTQPTVTDIGTSTTTPRNVNNTDIVTAAESESEPTPHRITVWGGAEEALSTFLNDRMDNPSLFM